MKKIIFIVIDGLPDEKVPELKNRTPLEAARRPNLDHLAKNGWCGFFKPLFLGKLPDSEEVHLALFGYDPRKYLPGRGVLEALGVNAKLLPQDIVLRGNLATIDKKGKVVDRRAGRIKTEQTEELVESLNGRVIDGVRILVKTIYGHRLAIILRGQNLSDKISETDDKKIRRIKKVRALGKGRGAERTARILNQFLEQSKLILENHPLNKARVEKGQRPANFILTRSAGKMKKVVPFKQKWGRKAGCLSYAALYRGIAKFLGMGIIKERDGDPFSASYLRDKFRAARDALRHYNFIFCHIKGADLLAEDGKAQEKKEFIEAIDKQLPILENLKDVLLVITADHATSSRQKSHAAFPIPILIYPAGQTRPEQKFTEKDCRKGNLGEIQNLKILPLILRIASN
ncbi:MAG: 2,3-bisphosphoglycerate-independent phosphoglycerate mutase [Candidatus Nealsonbacteria bacterium]|nr:2,3-bisphosphoglycerate-independent phosphoglycerate mutase [Candidatus Nealsonbacteria bacterium]